MNLLGQKIIGDYKRILMLIAANDVPGLCRLISAAFRRGLSAEGTVELIKEENDKNTGMSTFLNPAIKPRLHFSTLSLMVYTRKNVVMLDGVALEEKRRYCPEANDRQGIEDIRTAFFNPVNDDQKVCSGSKNDSQCRHCWTTIEDSEGRA